MSRRESQRVAAKRIVHGLGADTDGLLPFALRIGLLLFGQHEVQHPVEEIVLVRDVAVERHRLEPEILPEASHRHCFHA